SAGNSLSLGLAGAVARTAATGGADASYDRVFDGVDLRYTVLPEGLKDELVLHNASVPTRYRFDVHTSTDAAVARLRDGSWALTPKGGEAPAFVFVPPVAADAHGD